MSQVYRVTTMMKIKYKVQAISTHKATQSHQVIKIVMMMVKRMQKEKSRTGPWLNNLRKILKLFLSFIARGFKSNSIVN